MTDVTRIDALEAIARLNDLERAVPVYRAALEWVAQHADREAANIARTALDDARPRSLRRPLSADD